MELAIAIPTVFDEPSIMAMVVNEIDPRMILRELLGVSVYDSLKQGCSSVAYFQGLPLFHPPQVHV